MGRIPLVRPTYTLLPSFLIWCELAIASNDEFWFWGADGGEVITRAGSGGKGEASLGRGRGYAMGRQVSCLRMKVESLVSLSFSMSCRRSFFCAIANKCVCLSRYCVRRLAYTGPNIHQGPSPKSTSDRCMSRSTRYRA
jgi:hypothetical protein